MLCVILCSCGRSLGDLYEAFKAYRAYRWSGVITESGRKILPEFIPVADDLYPKLGDFFKMINIDHTCCKMKLLGTVEFNEP